MCFILLMLGVLLCGCGWIVATLKIQRSAVLVLQGQMPGNLTGRPFKTPLAVDSFECDGYRRFAYFPAALLDGLQASKLGFDRSRTNRPLGGCGKLLPCPVGMFRQRSVRP